MNTPASTAPAPAAGIRAAVTLLSLAAFFSGAALRICDGLLPRLSRDFGITAGTAGRVVLTFSVAYGLSQLAFGPLGDRYGKARLVCVALFGCALGALACAFAPGFDALVGLRVLWGFAAAGIIPLSMAWIGDAVPYEQRQATLARLLLGTLSGMMAGQLAGGLFGDAGAGWRGAFLTLCAGYAAVGVLLLLRLRHIVLPAAASTGRTAFAAQLASVLREPWARKVLAAALAEGVLLLGPMAFFPAYLHQRYGLALSAASALVALYAVGGLAYAAFARHIVRRFGERRMVLAGGLLMGGGFVALYFSPVAWLAGPLALLLGFGTYLYHNTLQTHATQMVPAVRGTSVAMFAFCLFFGQAIGVSWAGTAFDRFGSAPLLLVPALGLPLAGWAFARALQRRAA
ncbi:MAG: putative rane transport protein [Ramlibacter sp.]|nr:putative rane transport protein [Ramlibacter sp.]